MKENDKLVDWPEDIEEGKVNKRSEEREIGVDNIYRMFKKNINKGKFELKKCMII